MKRRPALALEGGLWVTAGGQPLGGAQRIALLQAIDQQG